MRTADTTPSRGRRSPLRRLQLFTGLAVLGALAIAGPAAPPWPQRPATVQGFPATILGFEVASLDGRGNNIAHPDWGQAGARYSRISPARYADGRGTQVAGTNPRYLSNRIFNDVNQDVFSEREISQWGWVWGQFLDHTIGLAKSGREQQDIPFDRADPLESFTNDLGVVAFTRSQTAPGTGVDSPREFVNTQSAYIDAEAVYGSDPSRLEWLREGPLDGRLGNNDARLLLPDGYLPTRTARGNPAHAPAMQMAGRLLAAPDNAVVAGDVRANENIALTALHTLFAREHNRIVSLLPDALSEEEQFQIARKVVIAEQQYITYHEFLPAMGVSLPQYAGYRPDVDVGLSNEFAVAGYRAHSQIHSDFAVDLPADRYAQAQLFEALGMEINVGGGEGVQVVVPLSLAYFNPRLVPELGLGPLLSSFAQPQYNNDEQVDNALRSVLFQIPVPGNPSCVQGPDMTPCFRGVTDLAAIDVQRGRDHGLGTYNQLRRAYGLGPRTSFTAVTGEATEDLPAGLSVDDRRILDYTSLTDRDGDPVALGTRGAVTSQRRTTLAARLRAVYGSVGNLDAFVGMMAEPHLPGCEFGELQLAIWARQFRDLRDGDRFFYANDPALPAIATKYGIDHRRTLKQIIASNSDAPSDSFADNVFFAATNQPVKEGQS